MLNRVSIMSVKYINKTSSKNRYSDILIKWRIWLFRESKFLKYEDQINSNGLARYYNAASLCNMVDNIIINFV